MSPPTKPKRAKRDGRPITSDERWLYYTLRRLRLRRQFDVYDALVRCELDYIRRHGNVEGFRSYLMSA